MVTLRTDDAELHLLPDLGGRMAAWRWRGMDILWDGNAPDDRLTRGSFPLVPFSNRIAGGRFFADGREVTVPANTIQNDRPQLIHGFGWQAAWSVVSAGQAQARLRHDHRGDHWPWPYRAEQHFALASDGLVLTLSLTNGGQTAMPAGLGIHPFFPRAGARLGLAVTGRWEVDDQCLPRHWTPLGAAPDWFGGEAIDNGFTGRSGPITIDWPTHRLAISPDPALAHTVVYVPAGSGYFCVEPVSHMTDAVNRPEPAETTGLRWLAPGETWAVSIDFALSIAR